MDQNEITHIQRYLDAVRTNLLFAKGVILVEGDAEEILIPVIVKQVYGISLDELGISLINVRSTGFENVAQLFHDDRIRRRCSILTDLDSAICDTSIHEGDSEKEIKYKKSVNASKKSGEERKKRIDSFTKGNSWIKPFYAKYTFEVDFVVSGNELGVEQTINEVYKSEKTKNLAEEEIASNDISKAGRRVLTMANQEGKGWYALILANYIDERTFLPQYILEGIVYAKEEWPSSIVSSIAKYRLDCISREDADQIDLNSLYSSLEAYSSGKITLEQLYTVLSEVADNQLDVFLKELI